jgi:hypothetical protein
VADPERLLYGATVGVDVLHVAIAVAADFGTLIA